MRVNALFAAALLAFWAAGAASGAPSSIEERMNARDGIPRQERIALWAEDFTGTPYDPDPFGAYVTRRAIVADDAVDCMYHVFRSVELGLSNSPDEAVERALELRFRTTGKLGPDGKVLNYGERFEYGEDMPASGKWGRDITSALGAALIEIPGSRGIANVSAVPAYMVSEILPALQSGDIVFFVKNPSRRVVGEIIGHMGIIKREGGEVFLIHASGRKSRNPGNAAASVSGAVLKLRLADYAATMPFVGIMVTRF